MKNNRFFYLKIFIFGGKFSIGMFSKCLMINPKQYSCFYIISALFYYLYDNKIVQGVFYFMV